MNSYTVASSTKEEAALIEEKIVEYNEANVSFEDTVPYEELNKHIKDQTGNIIAGINCLDYSWKCLFIDALWVKQEYRKSGLGSKLLMDIEQTARKYNMHLIHLETFDFQALGFYLKHGYEVYGELKHCPLNHIRYSLKKEIK